LNETAKRRRTPVWVIVLLILSLSANAFVAGLWGKRFLVDRSFEDRALHWVERTAERLPPPAREAYRARFEPRRGEFLARAEEAFDARRKIDEAMSAEPYDPAALRAAQKEARRNFVEMRQVMDQVLAETVDTMPPDARQRMSERWSRH
jgi:uncharacterized membrane protein